MRRSDSRSRGRGNVGLLFKEMNSASMGLSVGMRHPPEVRKGKDLESSLETPEGMHSIYMIINVFSMNPLNLWYFVTEAMGK